MRGMHVYILVPHGAAFGGTSCSPDFTGENSQRSARQGPRHPAKHDLGFFSANSRAGSWVTRRGIMSVMGIYRQLRTSISLLTAEDLPASIVEAELADHVQFSLVVVAIFLH